MNDTQNIKQLCLELMERSDAAFLTTVDADGFPQTRAMLNLRSKNMFSRLAPVFEDHKEDFLLYFTTYSKSNKMKEIRANPKASVYFCDAQIYHGMMLSGTIEIVDDPAVKETLWEDEWKIYYPSGLHGPEYGVLRLKPVLAKGWNKTETFEFRLNP